MNHFNNHKNKYIICFIIFIACNINYLFSIENNSSNKIENESFLRYLKKNIKPILFFSFGLGGGFLLPYCIKNREFITKDLFKKQTILYFFSTLLSLLSIISQKPVQKKSLISLLAIPLLSFGLSMSIIHSKKNILQIYDTKLITAQSFLCWFSRYYLLKILLEKEIFELKAETQEAYKKDQSKEIGTLEKKANELLTTAKEFEDERSLRHIHDILFILEEIKGNNEI